MNRAPAGIAGDTAQPPARPRLHTRPIGARLAVLGTLIVVLTGAVTLTTRPWPARLPLHLGFYVAAGVVWAAAIWIVPRLPRRSKDLHLLWALALLLRLPAWLAPPVHSDDVYRYAWDGHVARAGINPYRYPPAAPELDRLRDGVRYSTSSGERSPPRPTIESSGRPLWARINNADLPTIYPPVAQLVFLLAALLPLAPIAALKLVFALCDVGVLFALAALLRRLGHDPRRLLAWAWSPLVAIELGQNVHLDALPILMLVLALDAWYQGRQTLAGALLGLATAAKLITAPLVTSLRDRCTWLATASVIVLCTLPFLGAGLAIGGSTGEFARRWRANDGAYALLQAGFDRLSCTLLDQDASPHLAPGSGPRCRQALDLTAHPQLAHLITGRSHRSAVYPDELAAFSARAVVGALLALVVLSVAWRRLLPLDGAERTLGALLLLTPTLHPWYCVWILPLVTLRPRAAWVAMVVLVPLGYMPLGVWLAGGPWQDPLWTRLLVHGSCWCLLLYDMRRQHRPSSPP